MLREMVVIAALGGALGLAQAATESMSLEAINAAEWNAGKKTESGPAILKAQVLLARAGFSSGVYDARDGENFRKALKSFQQQNALEPSGKLDAETWRKLTESAAEPVVVTYTIAVEDVKGPFVDKIPKDYREMSELKRLAFRNPREALAEKFHMDEDLLATLNKGQDFKRPGTTIIVANVRQADEAKEKSNSGSREGRGAKSRAANKPRKENIRIEVNKSERTVRVLGEDGRQIAFYPASVGSEEKPAPSGTLEVRAVAQNPTYRYDPEFNFKGQKAKEPVDIAAGPNNPVGSVWIALSAETYGIHGTPHPEKVSKAESHGCVRLTNWDALALAKLVTKGTKVDFID